MELCVTCKLYNNDLYSIATKYVERVRLVIEYIIVYILLYINIYVIAIMYYFTYLFE